MLHIVTFDVPVFLFTTLPSQSAKAAAYGSLGLAICFWLSLLLIFAMNLLLLLKRMRTRARRKRLFAEVSGGAELAAQCAIKVGNAAVEAGVACWNNGYPSAILRHLRKSCLATPAWCMLPLTSQTRKQSFKILTSNHVCCLILTLIAPLFARFLVIVQVFVPQVQETWICRQALKVCIMACKDESGDSENRKDAILS